MSQVDDHFGVVVEHTGETREVTVHGEIDFSTAPAVEDAIVQLGGAEILVYVDMSDVRFLDSAGLAALMRAHDSLGGQLRIRRPSPAATRVLAITGIDSLIPVDP